VYIRGAQISEYNAQVSTGKRELTSEIYAIGSHACQRFKWNKGVRINGNMSVEKREHHTVCPPTQLIAKHMPKQPRKRTNHKQNISVLLVQSGRG
jgi:hypothetical protein